MYLSLFVGLGAVHLLALASPGPDFALILRTCLCRPLALGAALGISLAILLHALFSLTGLSLLLTQAPGLFALVRLAGALYLLWLAKGAWQAASLPAEIGRVAAGESGSWRRGLGWGLATNLLNPKALLFFVGLVAAMVRPEVGLPVRIGLALELFVLSGLWFGLLAWGLSTRRVQAGLARLYGPLHRLCAGLFALLGAGLLWELLAAGWPV